MNQPFSLTAVLKELRSQARPKELAGMARFGMKGDKRLGVAVPELRRLAKRIGKNHHLALELWQTGIPDARILAGMIDEADKVTERQLEAWVKELDSWDVCDQLCMNLFEKVKGIEKKIKQWSSREEEFVKRAAYALLACLAWHDKEANDEEMAKFLTIIKAGARDERNFVKKAVNWALRNIGKRNRRLNKLALKTAREIQKLDSKAARWIAADAIRELKSETVKKRLAKG
jgi:3-methyladenine DNA glycosylase AlkD